MIPTHPRLEKVKQSATDVIGTQAFELKQQGKSLVDFGIGEPFFNTPDHIKSAAKTAINNNITHYTPVGGLPVLKKAIINKLKRENNLTYGSSEVIVGVGAKQIIFNAFVATLMEDDEVIIPAPHWVSYPDMVLLAGAKPMILPTKAELGYGIEVDNLKRLMSDRVKWVIINSPSNPTGKVYSQQELEAIAKVLRKYPNTFILSDDIYEHVIFDKQAFCTLGQVAPDLKDRILLVNGVSKGYNMTGWRIGYGAGPEHLISALITLASQSTTNACSISQMAALAALEGSQDLHKKQSDYYQSLRDIFCAKLDNIPELDYVRSQGAFYMYIDCKKLIGKYTPKREKLTNDISVSHSLLHEAGVVVIPGSAFGSSPCFRVSLGVSKETLIEGCRRIKAFCMSLD